MAVPTVSPDEILREISHRPYDLPRAPWAMRQTWDDLLFAHWPVDSATLRSAVPAQLELDQFDGTAWIGVVPFAMNNIKPRFSPLIFNFLELNVRTYVTYRGRRGVLFFSLDASNPLAVEAARSLFWLPYYHAEMQMQKPNSAYRYLSKRHDARGPEANLELSYQPTTAPYNSQAGSIAEFFTERYCLFTADWRGRL
ncbi:MAG: YqjF family protein, partial [Terriglobales bacterium]